MIFLQDSDIRYMVQNFWGSQSVLSGNGVLANLRLVRWRTSEEWAPWNCILLTEEEAKVHYKIGEDLEEVSDDFRDAAISINPFKIPQPLRFTRTICWIK